MASRNYLSNSKAGFFEEVDDIDDETFLKESMTFQNNSSNQRIPNSNANMSPLNNSYSSNTYFNHPSQPTDPEQLRQQLLERRKEIESRTLQSSHRSLGLLRDSEQIGQATAEELMRQREQLERTEKRLDDINATLRFSQRHIQGIKSIFGSFKNYLSGKSTELPPLQPINSPSTIDTLSMNNSSKPMDSQLSSVLKNRTELGLSSSDDHPSFRLRGLDDFEGQVSSMTMEQALDKNLTDIGGSVSKLKELARGLGDEIDDQNELLEKLTNKTDRAEFTVSNQNKQMHRILK